MLGFIILASGIPLGVALWQGAWVMAIVVLAISLVPLSIYQNTRYEIRNGQLLITCGFLYKLTVDINRIRSIRNSRNLISSPALSLERQEIKFNTYDMVLISLKDNDKEEFYRIVKEINPVVQIL